jgi:hypothetical protein
MVRAQLFVVDGIRAIWAAGPHNRERAPNANALYSNRGCQIISANSATMAARTGQASAL